MSTTHDLVAALKAELRAAGLIYAALATELGMSESSVKRVFAKGDMPLSRIDEILRVLKMDFAELARQVADAQPLRRQLNVHGGIMRAQATSLVERLQRVGQDFAQRTWPTSTCPTRRPRTTRCSSACAPGCSPRSRI